MPAPDPKPITRRAWLRRVAATGATLALGCGVYAWRIEPHWVDVTYRKMRFAGLPPALEGKRLVQVSDLHIGPVVDNAYLRGALRRLAELEPDYIAITGDLMTSIRDEAIGLTIDTLRDSPIVDIPTFATLGNHDYSENFRRSEVGDRLADQLSSLGVQVLRNESVEVDGLQFAGCDDLWARRADLHGALEHVDFSRPAVCLAHNPDTADLPHWGSYSGWVLSGHTHGGQCRFPIVGAPVMPIRNKEYARGHVKLSGGRNLYVNRGLGYTRRIRFGVRPEITVFTLTTA